MFLIDVKISLLLSKILSLNFSVVGAIVSLIISIKTAPRMFLLRFRKSRKLNQKNSK